MFKHLTEYEIKTFALRGNVRIAAVKNFLSSLTGDRLADDEAVRIHAKLYLWDSSTVEAILDGIDKAYGRKEPGDDTNNRETNGVT